MLNTPFPPWPDFTAEECEAVSRILLSNRVNYWTGEECRLFEKEFADHVGTRHAVALANGTMALELALRGLGIGPGHEVVVTPRTFIASVSAIVAVGAVPVFADVDRESQNITSESIARVLTPRSRAVICVHLAGMPCDMDPIMELAASRRLFVVEDCAQSHGARYKGRPVGSIGHAGAWSFCQDKIITTGGEGGMVTTNDDDLWSAIWSFKEHGKSWSRINEPSRSNGFRWLHESFGSNCRLLEMQAAIGRIQLRRLPEWLLRRRSNASRIRDAARSITGLRVPDCPGWAEHAAYKCYLFVRPELLRAGSGRDSILAEVNELGVPCYTGTCPEVYLEKAFDGTGWRPAGRLPVARELGETSLMFLVHPSIEDRHVDKSCEVLEKVMGRSVLKRGPVVTGCPRLSGT